ncbi:MAG: TolC family protein [Fimbriimonadaceae bacterium]|nr:TolC family protein [Fimbriimonadaceae bacterium]
MTRSTLVSLAVVLATVGPAQTKVMTLDEAVATAKAQSPMLRAAKAEFRRAVAAERGSRAMTGPLVSANGFASTGNKGSLLFSPPGTDPAATMQVPADPFVGGSLMVMVPVLAGDVQAMASSAHWLAQAAAGDYREAESDLVLAVRQAYFASAASSEDVKAAVANLASLKELLRTTQAQYEAGKTVEASVRRVEAEVRRSERELSSAKNNEAKSLLDLLQLMGGTLTVPVSLEEPSLTNLPKGEVTDLVAQALDRRGLVLAEKAKAKASEDELRAARALGLPRVYAFGMADGANMREMGGLTVGLSLSFPLYDGGRVKSGVDQSKAMHERAEAELASARLQVEKEVRQAILDHDTAQANVISAEASVTAAASAYEVVAARVEAGKSILLEQLDALDFLTKARADATKARLDLALAGARLDRAVGGPR